jgi:hypothetical protein
MTGPFEVDVEGLSDVELAAALAAGVEGGYWSDQAAIGLLVTQRRWMGDWALRRAIVAEIGTDRILRAWVDWSATEAGPASSGELRIIELIRSLAGIDPGRCLSDLLCGLDDTNSERVLAAVQVALRGPDPHGQRPLRDLSGEE